MRITIIAANFSEDEPAEEVVEEKVEEKPVAKEEKKKDFFDGLF